MRYKSVVSTESTSQGREIEICLSSSMWTSADWVTNEENRELINKKSSGYLVWALDSSEFVWLVLTFQGEWLSNSHVIWDICFWVLGYTIALLTSTI